MMRRMAIVVGLLFAATGLLAHDHGWERVERCTDGNFRFDGEPGFARQEVIELGNLPSLKLEVRNAPVSVTGRNASGYTVTVCKGAARPEDLDAIRVRLEGGELKTSGPSHGDWSVTYRIAAPSRGDLVLTTKNGPLSVKDFDGRLSLDAVNGPLSLKNVEGEVRAIAKNGPVSLKGGSGSVEIRATNGPLSIGFEGAAWNGTLDASTKNGPLTVKLPANFGSGVVIEASGRSPVRCAIPGCRAVRALDRFDDEPQRIELGNGAPVVRLSTDNGPVTVREIE